MCLYATAFTCFGFLGPSPPGGASSVPVADSHSGLDKRLQGMGFGAVHASHFTEFALPPVL